MKNISLTLCIMISTGVYSQVGINTETPQRTFHINGSLQITNELNIGGDADTAGNAGNTGDILESAGPGVAPVWKAPTEIRGTVATAAYVQGTSALTINASNEAAVPGMTYSYTVPPGKTQTLLFTIQGYAVRATTANGQATQGVFALYQDGVKISSAYASSGDGGSLDNLPAPTTFMKSVTLSAGIYNFEVRYAAWTGNQTVNYLPSNYNGYNGDSEAMLTKMQVLVYNN